MSSKPLKTTGADQFRKADLAKIHIARKELGMSKEDSEGMILDLTKGKKSSSGELNQVERKALLARLEEKGFKEKKKPVGRYPGKPRNMGTGSSRAEQLGKIEALLTIGGLPWSYADGIAKQMRLADKVQWVRDDQLFKIITALRKKAQKEGWDLSGENK